MPYEDWNKYPATLGKQGDHSFPADGSAPSWIDRFYHTEIDATRVEGIDAQVHTLNCSCGCEGDAVVISEKGVEGAYIASTVTGATLLNR